MNKILKCSLALPDLTPVENESDLLVLVETSLHCFQLSSSEWHRLPVTMHWHLATKTLDVYFSPNALVQALRVKNCLFKDSMAQFDLEIEHSSDDYCFSL